jgi:ribosomal protein S18 acetylase RimI-like enzyme
MSVIRRAEKRDVEALGKLGVMLMETHHAFDRQRFLAPTPDASSGYSWFLGNMLDDDDACIFVADDGGEVAGYVYAALEPLSWKELRGPAGFIHDIAVREASRRDGIATQLMNAAIAWLREQGAPRVVLWTAAPNAGAQRLFHEAGFRDTMIEMTLELGK